MSEIVICKSVPLHGSVTVSGSKNAALPILAASILSPKKVILDNLPKLSDIQLMLEILHLIGADISIRNTKYHIHYQTINNTNIPHELVSRMRGSFLLAGPILARTGYVRLSMPGGCPIGTRPVDLHLKGFSALGADITLGHGYIDISAKQLNGNKIYLDFPSVGATENIMMAATLAKGTTIIENASAEPEIIALADFLNSMGAQIQGSGTDTIIITGVSILSDTQHSIIPDRIEAGTYMTAFAMTHGKGTIHNIIPAHLTPVTAKLREIGLNITEHPDSITIDAENEFHAIDIKTMPFPGFPTDMQSQFTSLLSTIPGTSIVVETVFENRFLHAGELNRMGAKIKIDGRTAIVEGCTLLTGAAVDARDLRGGAALVLAGLGATGATTVHGIEHINRGYDNLTGKLQSLGADITLHA